MSAPDPLKITLHALLEDYLERWPQEASTVQEFFRFMESQTVLQGKSNPLGHITASAWIVNAARTKALLTHHKKLGIWVQLGGHTDQGEDWLAASRREATEESGLSSLKLASPDLFDLDIHEIPAKGDAGAHLHYDLRFLFTADDQEPLTVSEESHNLAWVDLKNLESYTTEESQLRMRSKT